MSKFNINNGGSDLVNDLVYQNDWNRLKVMVFRGKTKQFNYPFKNTKDFLGVLCNEQTVNFQAPHMTFDMH